MRTLHPKSGDRTWLCVLLVTGLLTASVWLYRQRPVDPEGPKTLKEVEELARRLGLYCCGDRADGSVRNRLVLSEFPLTPERAHDLRFNQPTSPNWIGTVTVSINPRSYLPSFLPGRSLVWGELFVFGDPELIRKLTRRDPGQPAARFVAIGP